MPNPLFNPNLWESLDSNLSPPPEWNPTTLKYEFIGGFDPSEDVGLTYIGGPSEDNASFTAKMSVSGETSTLTVTTDGTPVEYNITDAGETFVLVQPFSSLSMVFSGVTGGNNPYGVDATITPVSDGSTVSPTPAPSATPLAPTPSSTGTVTPSPTPSVSSTPSASVTPSVSASPTPSVTPSVTLSPSGMATANNILQLLRRYSDGTLVAKREVYDGFYGYQHKQLSVATEWMINHNIGKVAMYDVFDQNNEKIVPSEIIQVDNCNLLIKFNAAQAGFANIVFLVNEQSQCVPPSATPSPTPSITPSVSPTMALVTPTPSPTPSVTPSLSGAPFPHNKVYAVGLFVDTDDTYNYLLRLDGTGHLDTTFANVFPSIGSNQATQIFHTPLTGNYYINGVFGNVPTSTWTVRLNGDGTVDNTFTNLAFSWISNNGSPLMAQMNNKIYVAGFPFTGINGTPFHGLGRLNSDGTVDTSYEDILYTEANNNISTMTTTEDQTFMYLAGSVIYTPDQVYRTMIRIDANGNWDQTYNGDVLGDPNVDNSAYISAITQTDDGKIYVAGIANNAGIIKRLNSDGTIDNGFTPITYSSNSVVSTIVQTQDEKIYVGGQFTGFNGYDYLVRLNSDGTFDNSFVNVALDGYVQKIMQATNSQIYLGGNFQTINGNPMLFLARLNDNGTIDTTYVNDLNLSSVVYDLEDRRFI